MAFIKQRRKRNPEDSDPKKYVLVWGEEEGCAEPQKRGEKQRHGLGPSKGAEEGAEGWAGSLCGGWGGGGGAGRNKGMGWVSTVVGWVCRGLEERDGLGPWGGEAEQ